MTQPTEEQTSGWELPIGTRVPFQRPDWPDASRGGIWAPVDSPDLTVLADADRDRVETDVVACYRAPVSYSTFKTGQWVRITYRQDGGVQTVQTGMVTVEAGSVRLGVATWVDWDELELLEVLNEPGSGDVVLP